MKSFAGGLIALATLVAPMAAVAEPLTYDTLKAMTAGLGYTPKDIGKESPKLEILHVTDGFNVPLGIEITKSGRFIWLTANLGPSKLTGDRALELLKRSKEWQPTQFWITSADTLTIGLAVFNADVKPDTLKFAIEKMGGDVGKTATIWQAQ